MAVTNSVFSSSGLNLCSALFISQIYQSRSVNNKYCVENPDNLNETTQLLRITRLSSKVAATIIAKQLALHGCRIHLHLYALSSILLPALSSQTSETPAIRTIRKLDVNIKEITLSESDVTLLQVPAHRQILWWRLMLATPQSCA